MLQVIKKNEGAFTFSAILIGVAAFLLLALGLLTAKVERFDWGSFGVFAALTPFILFFGGFVGKMIANKFGFDKSDIFRLSITLVVLAVITAVYFAIMFAAAAWANSFPVVDPLYFSIYGLFAWIMMIPTGCFASQWVEN